LTGIVPFRRVGVFENPIRVDFGRGSRGTRGRVETFAVRANAVESIAGTSSTAAAVIHAEIVSE
jgi:hypothetical protein